MPFRFSSLQVQEIVRNGKCLRLGHKLNWENEGQTGRKLALEIDLVDGPLVGIKLFINCHNHSDPTCYRSALVLEGERIRGVDYSLIARRRFYKEHIQKGWHENILDPSLPTNDPDRNRHPPLNDFAPTDLHVFLHLLADRWHIELDFEKGLL
jgi:hypothetical protein